MQFYKKTTIGLMLFLAITMSSCLNILEEITFKKSGSGHYKMSIDMSQMKQMMEMLKGMGGQDSTGTGAAEMGQLDQMGAAFTQLSDVLHGVRGLKNTMAINDTTNFVFGYEFDFDDIDALNRAVKKIGDQGETKGGVPDALFTFKKGKFERLDASGGMVEDMKKAMIGGDENMEQAKMMFADMTATTIYNFPDQKVSKQNHSSGEISKDGHSIKIELKPFAEGADLKKMGSGIKAKIK